MPSSPARNMCSIGCPRPRSIARESAARTSTRRGSPDTPPRGSAVVLDVSMACPRADLLRTVLPKPYREQTTPGCPPSAPGRTPSAPLAAPHPGSSHGEGDRQDPTRADPQEQADEHIGEHDPVGGSHADAHGQAEEDRRSGTGASRVLLQLIAHVVTLWLRSSGYLPRTGDLSNAMNPPCIYYYRTGIN